MSVDAYYAGRPSVEREVFEAVREHLESLGPVIVEPVGVGVLFKGKRTFVELRPKTKWVALSFGLHRRVDHPRITRTTKTNIGRTYHAIRVTSRDDIDDTVRGWLTESYLELAN